MTDETRPPRRWKGGIEPPEVVYVQGVLHDRSVRGEEPGYREPGMTGLPKTTGESRETISAFDLANRTR